LIDPRPLIAPRLASLLLNDLDYPPMHPHMHLPTFSAALAVGGALWACAVPTSPKIPRPPRTAAGSPSGAHPLRSSDSARATHRSPRAGACSPAPAAHGGAGAAMRPQGNIIPQGFGYSELRVVCCCAEDNRVALWEARVPAAGPGACCQRMQRRGRGRADCEGVRRRSQGRGCAGGPVAPRRGAGEQPAARRAAGALGTACVGRAPGGRPPAPRLGGPRGSTEAAPLKKGRHSAKRSLV
jgi:hypothetical protein